MRFNLKVSHIPGEEFVIEDAVSSNPTPHDSQDVRIVEEVEVVVDALRALWPASRQHLEQIREAAADPILRQVLQFIVQG